MFQRIIVQYIADFPEEGIPRFFVFVFTIVQHAIPVHVNIPRHHELHVILKSVKYATSVR